MAVSTYSQYVFIALIRSSGTFADVETQMIGFLGASESEEGFGVRWARRRNGVK